jgi:leader peptidase (prepilin peptidase) / N-methyltransferase
MFAEFSALIATCPSPWVAGILGYLIAWPLGFLSKRHPKMLKDQWTLESWEHLNLSPKKFFKATTLFTPRPHCDCSKPKPLRWYQQLPIISFLLYRGMCPNCPKSAIPRFYLAIECLCPLLSMLTVSLIPDAYCSLYALFFTWILLLLTCIDSQTHYLPDTWTLSLLWLGLLLNTQNLLVPLHLAVWGAAFGYLIPWTILTLYRLVRGHEGMGYGDLKMLAMLGAWFGPYWVITCFLLAIYLALAVLLVKKLACRSKKDDVMHAFGPFLAISGWLHLVYGATIYHWFQALIY